MDTTRFIDPITDRVPVSGAAIVSTVADVTSGLVEQVGDLDLSDSVRRTRRTIARFVPWMSDGRSRSRRRWVIIGAVTAAVVAVAVLQRRGSTSESSHSQARDDWTTGSSNGDSVTSSPEVEREAVTSTAP
jgi:hypothetical protein